MIYRLLSDNLRKEHVLAFGSRECRIGALLSGRIASDALAAICSVMRNGTVRQGVDSVCLNFAATSGAAVSTTKPIASRPPLSRS